MAYRVVGVNSLEDGSFYFRAQHWPDEASMRAGEPPEWENDFVTDLHLVAGSTLSRVKVQHDAESGISLMQRPDTLEWRPLADWHGEDGLLAQGVEPAREEFSPGQEEVELMVRDTVRRYIARREAAALRQSRVGSGGDVTGRGLDKAAVSLSADTTDQRLRSLPSRKSALHPHLQAVEGLEDASL